MPEKIATPAAGGYDGRMDIPANAADQALLARVSGGDAAALRTLYDVCAGRAMSIAYRVLASRSEAEEVVQETFVQVWRQAASYDASRGGAMAWIATIVRSRALDRLRSRAASERASATMSRACCWACLTISADWASAVFSNCLTWVPRRA